MKYEISNDEKIIIISSLNSRLVEYRRDPYFNILYKYDFADWAENLKAPQAKYIDSINKLLIKLGHKKQALFFEEIIQKIKELKKCKHFFLIGQDNDYYKLIPIANNLKTTTIGLKADLTINNLSNLEWISRTQKWIELESKKELGKRVSRKQAWNLISRCNYARGSEPNHKMLRFLKVILK